MIGQPGDWRFPDTTSLDLAERTPFPYSVVHEALRMLAVAGIPHERAVELVTDAAEARVNPCEVARVYLSWAGPAAGSFAAEAAQLTAAASRLRAAVIAEARRSLIGRVLARLILGRRR